VKPSLVLERCVVFCCVALWCVVLCCVVLCCVVLSCVVCRVVLCCVAMCGTPSDEDSKPKSSSVSERCITSRGGDFFSSFPLLGDCGRPKFATGIPPGFGFNFF